MSDEPLRTDVLHQWRPTGRLTFGKWVLQCAACNHKLAIRDGLEPLPQECPALVALKAGLDVVDREVVITDLPCAHRGALRTGEAKVCGSCRRPVTVGRCELHQADCTVAGIKVDGAATIPCLNCGDRFPGNV